MTSKHVSHVRKLYKLVLRLHRSLPADLRFLGDSYAKEEFRLHKKCKPEEAQIFLSEWQNYAAVMSRQVAPAKPEKGHTSDEEIPQVLEAARTDSEQTQKVCEEDEMVGEEIHGVGEGVHDVDRKTRKVAEVQEMPQEQLPAPRTPPAVRSQSTRAPVPATPSQALVTVHRSLRPMPSFGFHLPQEMVIRFSNEQIHRFYELEEAAGEHSNYGRFSDRSVHYGPARGQNGQRPIAPPAVQAAAARVLAIRAQAEPIEPAERDEAGNPNEENAGVVVKKER